MSQQTIKSINAIGQDPPVLSNSIQDQFFRTRRILSVSVLVGLLGFLGVYALSSFTRQPFSYFTRDPASITHSKFYIGLLSNLGIMLWTATATICLFVAFFVRSHGNDSGF